MKKTMACLASLLLLCSLAGCGGQKQQYEVPELLEPVKVQMDTVTAQIGDLYNISVYDGEVVPFVEELSFPADGYLEEITVIPGDYVQEGDVLALLDAEIIREQIDELTDEIEYTTQMGEFNDRELNVRIEMAQIELDEILDAIEEEQNISVTERKLREVELTQMQTRLTQAQEERELTLSHLNAQLEELRQKLTNTQLTAPFSGQIVYVSSMEPGAPIEGYSTLICLADTTRLHISSDYVAEYKISSADRIYARILDQEYDVTYQEIDPEEYIAAALEGGEKKSSFVVNASAPELESGQYAAIVLISSYKDQTLVIPCNALYRDESGHYVYKIVNDERVRQNVRVGVSTNIEAEILEGLQEGDVVYVKE